MYVFLDRGVFENFGNRLFSVFFFYLTSFHTNLSVVLNILESVPCERNSNEFGAFDKAADHV